MPRRTMGVAIGLPEPAHTDLQGWRERFGDPNAADVPPHVTLLPPTALPASALDEVEEHLRTVAAGGAPFAMRLRGTATFRPVSAVVFVPVVQGIADCERVEAQVRGGPLQRTLKFPYHPHVTVAHDLPPEALDHAFDALADYDAAFTVWGFTLFEQDAGRVWRPQRDFPFGAEGRPGPLEAASTP